MRTPFELAPLAAIQSPEALASQCASASGPRYRLAEYVRLTAVIVAELKLSQVQREILLADMMEAPHHATLEETPKRFEIVGMNLSPYILASTVADGFVREILFQEAIARMFVCGYQVNRFADGLAHECVERYRVCALDYLTDHVALPANGPDYTDFAGTDSAGDVTLFVPMPVLVFPADEHFVYFDDTHELPEVRIVHSRSKSHAHIPSCLVGSASDLPLNLKCAHAFLGIEHLPENFEPSLERVFRILKDRPADDAETVIFAELTEPVERPRVQFIDGGIPAFRALNDAIRPAVLNQIKLARFVRREAVYQFSERHHGC
jgi:hypothetical protein